jgi:hypothetical protein
LRRFMSATLLPERPADPVATPSLQSHILPASKHVVDWEKDMSLL